MKEPSDGVTGTRVTACSDFCSYIYTRRHSRTYMGSWWDGCIMCHSEIGADGSVGVHEVKEVLEGHVTSRWILWTIRIYGLTKRKWNEKKMELRWYWQIKYSPKVDTELYFLTFSRESDYKSHVSDQEELRRPWGGRTGCQGALHCNKRHFGDSYDHDGRDPSFVLKGC